MNDFHSFRSAAPAWRTTYGARLGRPSRAHSRRTAGARSGDAAMRACSRFILLDSPRRRIHCMLLLGGVGALLSALNTPCLARRSDQTPEIARLVSSALGMQGRLLWIDGTANVFRRIRTGGTTRTVDFTTTKEGVAEIVRRCKAIHINTLVVDVKPLSGQVLYRSRVAPRMTQWKGQKIPDFDVLAAFIEEAHRAGLKVDACINALSEGHKYYNAGLAFQHTDWQSVVYTVDRGMVAPDGSRLPVRVTLEPDDPARVPLLSDEESIQGSGTPSGLVGLEATGGANGGSAARSRPVGKQLNLVLDADRRVIGVLDSALLGDDPLVAPEGGYLIPATQEADRAWIARHLKPGMAVRFDLKTNRSPIAQTPSEKVACFVNPLHPEVRQHELDVVRELVSGYDIDGLVLDRCRYSNLYNDFSDRSRDAFARWLGKPITRWPEDVLAFSQAPGAPPIRGPLFKPWLEFRAQVIRDFVAEIARCAREIKPDIVLGTYVGSWYPEYYFVGVNWASDRTALRYSWFTQNYPRTGYAEFFDWISTGCYYQTATREEARLQGRRDRATVEDAVELSNQAIANGAFVYPGLNVQDYAGRPEALLRALDIAGRKSHGWMLFDLSHIEEFQWWPYLERAVRKDASAPHRVPDLLSALRTAADSAQ